MHPKSYAKTQKHRRCSTRERLLAYLPLAHIIDFVFKNATLYWGSVLGYGNPRTLTDQSVRKCPGISVLSSRLSQLAYWLHGSLSKKDIKGRLIASGTLKSNVF